RGLDTWRNAGDALPYRSSCRAGGWEEARYLLRSVHVLPGTRVHDRTIGWNLDLRRFWLETAMACLWSCWRDSLAWFLLTQVANKAVSARRFPLKRSLL